ncbi:MAG: YciI family protein, partial [Acidobacteriota bacterium]|nr:YciI family protein [Acidobacteriota bacterium]
LDGAGLQASSKGARVTWKQGQPQVVDGPFAETKELLAGFWMIKVNSLAEAVEWTKKAPFHMLPQDGSEPQIELRQVFELEDFPDVPEEVAKMNEAFTTGGRHK